MVAPRRVMIKELDSVEQASSWLQNGRSETVARLCAILRVACLLEETVVVTYAQLLDGVFFLDQGPDQLSKLLGRDDGSLPLVVAIEHGVPDLAGAYDQMCSRGPAFVWSSRTVPLDQRCRERFQHSRTAWLEAAAEGRMGTDTYVRSHADMAQALGRESVPDLPPEIRLAWDEHQPQPELARWQRSDFVQANDAGVAEGHISASQAAACYEWWNSAYSRALASSNRASWISFTEVGQPDIDDRFWHSRLRGLKDLLRLARGQIADVLDRDVVVLNGTLLDDMRQMPASLYAAVHYRTGEAVERWRANPGGLTLNGVGFAVRELIGPVPTWGRVMLWSLIRAVFIVGIAAYLLVGDIAQETGHSVPLWTTLLAGFLACLPWGEIGALLSARPGRLQAVIRVQTE